MDGLAVSLQYKQHILAVGKFLDVIRQAAFSHLLCVLYRCPGRGGMALQRCNQLVHVFFQQVRPYDKHHFIASLHVVSKLEKSSVVSIWYLAASSQPFHLSHAACIFETEPSTNYQIRSTALVVILPVKPVHRDQNALIHN